MSEYMFGVLSAYRRFDGWDRAKRHAIAKEHGCTWTEIHDEQTGRYKSWFSSPDAGEESNAMTESAVMAAIEEAARDERKWDWLADAATGDTCLLCRDEAYTHDPNAFRDDVDFIRMCERCFGEAPETLEDVDLVFATLRDDGLWLTEDGYLYRILDPAVLECVGKPEEVMDGSTEA